MDPTSHARRSYSILVVEDDASTRSYLEKLLLGEGYVARTAEHAGEAQAHLRDLEYEPDLILMDIQLPGMGGLELARQIKSNPDRRQIHIVAMTAFHDAQHREWALEAGCLDYLPKPFSAQVLLELLASHLRPLP